MIENIRATRDRALQLLSAEAAGAGGSVSRYWRQEWEQLYPGLNIDWKQVVSRYHYHFGAERRDSADGEITSYNNNTVLHHIHDSDVRNI